MAAKLAFVLVSFLCLFPAYASAQARSANPATKDANASNPTTQPAATTTEKQAQPKEQTSNKENSTQPTAKNAAPDKNPKPQSPTKPNMTKTPEKSEDEKVIESMDFLMLLELLKDYNLISES
jgi:hypothetical protein